MMKRMFLRFMYSRHPIVIIYAKVLRPRMVLMSSAVKPM